MESEEMLSVYDRELNETGIATRSEVHLKGLLHKVVHCWIIDDSSNEKWVYFQQRSHTKKDFPGLYDISAAGHIDIGEKGEDAVKREIKEEIGIDVDDKKLIFAGCVREQLRLNEFNNNESCEVYLYPVKNPEFHLGHEVERLIKISLYEFEKYVFDNSRNIEAFSVDNNERLILSIEEFCIHEKKYLESIIDFMRKLLLIK